MADGASLRPRAAQPAAASPARVSGHIVGRAAPVVLDQAGALAALEQLYADMTDLAFTGLCGDSCLHHPTPPPAARTDLDAPPTKACPALTHILDAAGGSAVHPYRPMIWRLLGPRGGHALSARVHPHLRAPRRHRHPAPGSQLASRTSAPPHPGTWDFLEQCWADLVSARLMARMLRGNGNPTPTPGDRQYGYLRRRRPGSRALCSAKSHPPATVDFVVAPH